MNEKDNDLTLGHQFPKKTEDLLNDFAPPIYEGQKKSEYVQPPPGTATPLDFIDGINSPVVKEHALEVVGKKVVPVFAKVKSLLNLEDSKFVSYTIRFRKLESVLEVENAIGESLRAGLKIEEIYRAVNAKNFEPVIGFAIPVNQNSAFDSFVRSDRLYYQARLEHIHVVKENAENAILFVGNEY